MQERDCLVQVAAQGEVWAAGTALALLHSSHVATGECRCSLTQDKHKLQIVSFQRSYT